MKILFKLQSKTIFFFISVSWLVVASCKNPKPAPKVSVEIENFMKEYRNAWIEGDSSKVLEKISDSVLFFMPTKKGQPIIGKDSLKEFWFPKSEISYPILDYQVKHSYVVVSEDIAVYQGLSRLIWCTLENNTPRDTVTSMSEFTDILKNENGEWKILSIMYVLKDSSYVSKPFGTK